MSTIQMQSITEGCLGMLSADPAGKRHNGSLNGAPSNQDIDSLIARELTHLSMQERESVLDDVHGISKAIDEDPHIVEYQLLEMDKTLGQIKYGSDYEEAEAMAPEYVENRDFRLMFLRADKFKPRDAACRMVSFFALKKKLFGIDKLVKDITLDDLSEDDLECLLSGGCGQVSPYKDTAGRHIVTFVTKLRKYKTPENAMRASFYVMMSTTETVDSQKRGVVYIYYNIGSKQKKAINSELRNTLPVHIASVHLCLNDPNEYASVMVHAIRCLNTKTRVRFRMHWGSHIECQYELGTFGIPRIALPVSSEGEEHVRDHLAWLAKRREIEAARVPSSFDGGIDIEVDDNLSMCNMSSFILYPDDVLFGRGKAVVDHPGNTRFRQIVDVYMNKYERAGRLEKTCIAEAIVRMIKESSGRFLKRENGGDWEEVDDSTARKKVAHAFRNRRKLHGYGGDSSSY